MVVVAAIVFVVASGSGGGGEGQQAQDFEFGMFCQLQWHDRGEERRRNRCYVPGQSLSGIAGGRGGGG